MQPSWKAQTWIFSAAWTSIFDYALFIIPVKIVNFSGRKTRGISQITIALETRLAIQLSWLKVSTKMKLVA